MKATAPIRAYRIRWRDQEQQPDARPDRAGGDRQVRATVDHGQRRITATVPGGAAVTVDVVAARALAMVLSDAVYRSLEPDGPLLSIEADNGDGWIALRELT